MPLVGKTVEEQMWNFFMARVGNAFGVAALMGHWYAESGLRPANLQNSFEKKLGCTDESYTKAVDNGSYTNFVHDSAGYGLAQWTYWSRKQALLNFARGKGRSIGDTEMQFEFGYQELSTSYKNVLAVMKSAKSVREASDVLLAQYERPADQSEAVKVKRAGYGEEFYKKYAGAGTRPQNGGSNMSNSALVDCRVLSPNHSGKRTKALCRITPHCAVGQMTAERIGGCFTSESRRASCNYGIGTEGRTVLVVDEAYRSWCSSSNDNDQQAVTIECASDKTAPYAMNSRVYDKLIKLCVDICKRNGKKRLLWLGSKEKTLAYTPKVDEMVLTAHRWFANKSCPGDWLYSRYGDLAEQVNKLLGSDDASGSLTVPAGSSSGDTVASFPDAPFQVQVHISDLCIRKSPGMGSNKTGKYTGKGTFTILEARDGWGRLKSGAGWIWLKNPAYCTVKGNAASAPAAGRPAESARKPVEEIAREVRLGKWGNGAERKKKLEAAGYNYAQVRAAVYRLME